MTSCGVSTAARGHLWPCPSLTCSNGWWHIWRPRNSPGENVAGHPSSSESAAPCRWSLNNRHRKTTGYKRKKYKLLKEKIRGIRGEDVGGFRAQSTKRLTGTEGSKWKRHSKAIGLSINIICTRKGNFILKQNTFHNTKMVRDSTFCHITANFKNQEPIIVRWKRSTYIQLSLVNTLQNSTSPSLFIL